MAPHGVMYSSRSSEQVKRGEIVDEGMEEVDLRREKGKKHSRDSRGECIDL